MENKKRTKKELFNMLKAIEAVSANQELIDFINHELELLSRKSSGERKPSKNAKVNIEIKEEILKLLSKEPNRLFTATEIWKSLRNWQEFTIQRISAVLKQLKEDNRIERMEEKKKPIFKIKEA